MVLELSLPKLPCLVMVCGVATFLCPGVACNLKLAAGGIGITAGLLYYQRMKKSYWPATEAQAVIITGCDSGLGYSLAVHAHQLGLTVIAMCFQSDGDGAHRLRQLCDNRRIFIIHLDVTNETSVQEAVNSVQAILQGNKNLEIKALVNNAGVMVFGEFEWQTEKLIRNQVEVNVLGTMRVTKAFCSIIRQHQGRIITISSHCATQALPGLAAYGATKAALKAWSDGLRVEQAKYGVPVISFVPGSFFQSSNILSRQMDYAKEMETSMTPEDQHYFGAYFNRYNEYLGVISGPRDTVQLLDSKLYETFEDALLSRYPSAYYEHGPLRYTIYHFLFKISPTWFRDHLVLLFMQMPTWRGCQDSQNF